MGLDTCIEDEADIMNGAFSSVSVVLNLRSGLRAGVCGVAFGGIVV